MKQTTETLVYTIVIFIKKTTIFTEYYLHELRKIITYFLKKVNISLNS